MVFVVPSNTDIPLLFKPSELLLRFTMPNVVILVLRRIPGGASSELRRLLVFKEEGDAMPGGPYCEPPLFDDNDNGRELLNESESRRPGGREEELLLADERRRRSSGIEDEEEEGGVGMGDNEDDVSCLKRPIGICAPNLEARS